MSFTRRTSCPSDTNKHYLMSSYGGWNGAIAGSPQKCRGSVLSNCVGYAQGRFCEIYTYYTGYQGNKFYYLNCNAEQFIERCKDMYPELQFSNDPKPGSIMCWEGKGSLAGHVAVVEDVIDKDTVVTSESNYNGDAWFSKTRRRGSDGRWGLNSNFTFRAFILNPAVVEEGVVEPVERDTSVDQVQVECEMLRVREKPSTSAKILGYCPIGWYNVHGTATNDSYVWYTIEEGKFIAGVDGVAYHSKTRPTVKELEKKIEELEAELAVANSKLASISSLTREIEEILDEK